jgi:transcriptional regulator with XRE-family HTH domain
MTLGQRLVEVRKNNGATQEEVAKALGISRILYSHYERDKATPPIWRLMRLACFFDLSVEQLMKDVEPKQEVQQ